jgi:hypothetical protein
VLVLGIVIVRTSSDYLTPNEILPDRDESESITEAYFDNTALFYINNMANIVGAIAMTA